MTLSLVLRVSASVLQAFFGADRAFAAGGVIHLLEPIGGVKELNPGAGGPLGLFFAYFNLLYPWLVGLASGVALLMVVVGGFQVMTSGDDSSARSNGLNRVKWAIGGLLFLSLISVILKLLNPGFYV